MWHKRLGRLHGQRGDLLQVPDYCGSWENCWEAEEEAGRDGAYPPEDTGRNSTEGSETSKIICGKDKREDAGKKQEYGGEVAGYTKEGWATAEAINHGDGNEYSKPEVVIVGDSNTRNVGKNFVLQTENQYVAILRSGAKIEDMGYLLGRKSWKRNIDVCCGAGN